MVPKYHISKKNRIPRKWLIPSLMQKRLKKKKKTVLKTFCHSKGKIVKDHWSHVKTHSSQLEEASRTRDWILTRIIMTTHWHPSSPFSPRVHYDALGKNSLISLQDMKKSIYKCENRKIRERNIHLAFYRNHEYR